MIEWYGQHITIIQSSVIYVLLAFSVQLALRAGVFSFAGVGFFGLGGYAAAILALRGVPGPLTVLIVAVGAVIPGYLLALLMARLRDLYLGMATIAFTLMIGVFASNGGNLTGGAVGLFSIPYWASTPVMLAIFVVAAVLMNRLECGNFGRALDALRENQDLTLSMGVDVHKLRKFIFTLGTVLGALSGALYVLTLTAIDPETASFRLVVSTLTMVILGGVGTWIGPVAGALIVVWLPVYLGPLEKWADAIYGLIVVVIAMYAPDGLVALARRGWTALARRERRKPWPGSLKEPKQP
jgi:branched-chain amino acid transport system permease protein